MFNATWFQIFLLILSQQSLPLKALKASRRKILKLVGSYWSNTFNCLLGQKNSQFSECEIENHIEGKKWSIMGMFWEAYVLFISRPTKPSNHHDALNFLNFLDIYRAPEKPLQSTIKCWVARWPVKLLFIRHIKYSIRCSAILPNFKLWFWAVWVFECFNLFF